jgi:hypothetical protein
LQVQDTSRLFFQCEAFLEVKGKLVPITMLIQCKCDHIHATIGFLTRQRLIVIIKLFI